MNKEKLIIPINMTDYQKKINDYSFEQLTAEKEKIAKNSKLFLDFIGLLLYHSELFLWVFANFVNKLNRKQT